MGLKSEISAGECSILVRISFEIYDITRRDLLRARPVGGFDLKSFGGRIWEFSHVPGKRAKSSTRSQ
jgi:hypothetical protein